MSVPIVFSDLSPLDLQSDILNYLVQESLAHAALIFATLVASFTFAAGFQRKVVTGPKVRLRDLLRNRLRAIYFAVLFVLFFIAIYAFFRFIFYAAITSYLLNQAKPPNPADSLGFYWRNSVRDLETNGPWFMIFSGYGGWPGLFGVILSIVLAFVFAVAVTLLAGSSDSSSTDSRTMIEP